MLGFISNSPAKIWRALQNMYVCGVVVVLQYVCLWWENVKLGGERRWVEKECGWRKNVGGECGWRKNVVMHI